MIWGVMGMVMVMVMAGMVWGVMVWYIIHGDDDNDNDRDGGDT